jgi:hypothetical protein
MVLEGPGMMNPKNGRKRRSEFYKIIQKKIPFVQEMLLTNLENLTIAEEMFKLVIVQPLCDPKNQSSDQLCKE